MKSNNPIVANAIEYAQKKACNKSWDFKVGDKVRFEGHPNSNPFTVTEVKGEMVKIGTDPNFYHKTAFIAKNMGCTSYMKGPGGVDHVFEEDGYVTAFDKNNKVIWAYDNGNWMNKPTGAAWEWAKRNFVFNSAACNAKFKKGDKVVSTKTGAKGTVSEDYGNEWYAVLFDGKDTPDKIEGYKIKAVNSRAACNWNFAPGKKMIWLPSGKVVKLIEDSKDHSDFLPVKCSDNGRIVMIDAGDLADPRELGMNSEAVCNYFDYKTPGAQAVISAIAAVPGGPTHLKRMQALDIKKRLGASDKDFDSALRYFQFDGINGVANSCDCAEAENAVPIDGSLTPMSYIKGAIAELTKNPGAKDVEGRAWKVIREKPNYKALEGTSEYKKLDGMTGINSVCENADDGIKGYCATCKFCDGPGQGCKKYKNQGALDGHCPYWVED